MGWNWGEAGAIRPLYHLVPGRMVLEMAYTGSDVHIACAFSIIELIAVL